MNLFKDFFQTCGYPDLKPLITKEYLEQISQDLCYIENPILANQKDDCDKANKIRYKTKKATFEKCLKWGVCFRQFDDILNKKPFCVKKLKNADERVNGCRRLTPTDFQASCQLPRFTHRVVKSIRILSLQELESENLNQIENLKIIYLFRDPRAVANSRIHIGSLSKSPDFKARLIQSCTKMKDNLSYLQKNYESGWLNQTNFFPVRYEDFAINFEILLPKIYKFSNLPLDRKYEKFLSWLKVNTEKKNRKKRSENRLSRSQNSTKLSRIKRTYIPVNGLTRFGTSSHDAKRVVSKWKAELPWSYIKLMQESCGQEVFQKFGYLWYQNDQEVRRSFIQKKLSYIENWSIDSVL